MKHSAAAATSPRLTWTLPRLRRILGRMGVLPSGSTSAAASAISGRARSGSPLSYRATPKLLIFDPISQLSAGKPDGQKQVALVLKLTNGGTPVRGADVSAMVTDADGMQAAPELRDDGQHDDGAAGDGVYGTKTGPITMAAAVVTARVGDATRITVGALGSSAPAQRSVFLPLVRC